MPSFSPFLPRLPGDPHNPRQQPADHHAYSVAALGELEYVAEKCESILNDALDIFSRHKAKPGELDDITDREEEIDELTEKLRDSHIQRLTEGLCTPKSGTNFLDLLINLERVSDHAANIAYSVNN